MGGGVGEWGGGRADRWKGGGQILKIPTFRFIVQIFFSLETFTK
jgi:hypothetical protein